MDKRDVNHVTCAILKASNSLTVITEIHSAFAAQWGGAADYRRSPAGGLAWRVRASRTRLLLTSQEIPEVSAEAVGASLQASAYLAMAARHRANASLEVGTYRSGSKPSWSSLLSAYSTAGGGAVLASCGAAGAWRRLSRHTATASHARSPSAEPAARDPLLTQRAGAGTPPIPRLRSRPSASSRLSPATGRPGGRPRHCTRRGRAVVDRISGCPCPDSPCDDGYRNPTDSPCVPELVHSHTRRRNPLFIL